MIHHLFHHLVISKLTWSFHLMKRLFWPSIRNTFWCRRSKPETVIAKMSTNMFLLNGQCSDFIFHRCHRRLPVPKTYRRRHNWAKRPSPVEFGLETPNAFHSTMQSLHGLINSTRAVSPPTEKWLWRPKAEFWRQWITSSLNRKQYTWTLTRDAWIAYRIDINYALWNHTEWVVT